MAQKEGSVCPLLRCQGCLPNVVTCHLVHNLRKWRVPAAYITFMGNLLLGRRKTRLKFDDYTSDWFELDNGFGQGDPLSMLLYLFYNTDLLDTANGPDEKSLGYVDDIAFMAMANNSTQTHRVLKGMMLWAWGGFQRSEAHKL